jgi:hypothetical protein
MLQRNDCEFDLLLVECVLGDGDGFGYFVRVDDFAIARVVDRLSFEGVGLGSAVET